MLYLKYKIKFFGLTDSSGSCRLDRDSLVVFMLQVSNIKKKVFECTSLQLKSQECVRFVFVTPFNSRTPDQKLNVTSNSFINFHTKTNCVYESR